MQASDCQVSQCDKGAQRGHESSLAILQARVTSLESRLDEQSHGGMDGNTRMLAEPGWRI